MLKIDSLSNIITIEFDADGNADLVDSLNRAYETKEKVSVLGTEGLVSNFEIGQKKWGRRIAKLHLDTQPLPF